MPDTRPQGSFPLKETLGVWLDFVREQSHFLSLRPNLVFQQALNTAENSTVCSVAADRLSAGREMRPYVLRLNKSAGPDAATLTLLGHQGEITRCVFSTDGRYVLSGSADGTIRLWDSSSGATIQELGSHEGPSALSETQCQFTSDNTHALLSSNKRTLQLWDLNRAKAIAELAHDNVISTCAFSSDGLLIASGCQTPYVTLKLWNGITGEIIASADAHQNSITCCVFSPDGHLLASASDDRFLKIWSTERLELVATLDDHDREWWRNSGSTAPGGIKVCVFSPDGQTILSGAADSTLKLWDIRGGKLLTTLRGHTGRIISCVFSPDGRRLVSGAEDTTVRVWDAGTGAPIAILEGHEKGFESPVKECAFSPDGRLMLTAAGDRTIRLWDTESWKMLATLPQAKSPCAFSPDGRRIVSAMTGGPTPGLLSPTMKIWTVDSVLRLESSNAHPATAVITDCAISENGKVAITASDSSTDCLIAWNVKTGDCTGRFDVSSIGINSCAISSDGQRAVVASGTDLQLWSVEDRVLLATLKGHNATITGCAFSPEEDRILSYGLDCTIRVWDSRSGSCMVTLVGHERGISEAAFSPDGARIASTSADATLILWDPSKGEIISGIQFNTAVHHCVFSPDGSRILCAEGGARAEGTRIQVGFPWRLILCDANPDSNGQLDASILGQLSGSLRCVAFSVDGSRVVSAASQDTGLKIWDVATSTLLQELGGHTGELRVCSFSRDGRFILSGSDDRLLRIWENRDGKLIGQYECSAAITVAQWSAGSDLIVVGTAGGDVLILRLNNFEPPGFKAITIQIENAF